MWLISLLTLEASIQEKEKGRHGYVINYMIAPTKGNTGFISWGVLEECYMTSSPFISIFWMLASSIQWSRAGSVTYSEREKIQPLKKTKIKTFDMIKERDMTLTWKYLDRQEPCLFLTDLVFMLDPCLFLQVFFFRFDGCPVAFWKTLSKIWLASPILLW